MSDGPQGYGWWQASDLKWYPPERHADYVKPLPPPPPPEPRGLAGPAAPRGDVRRLTEAERAQILDVALLSRVRPSILIIDGYIRNNGPTITRWNTSAEVEWVTPVTHPGRILVSVILTVITCGFYVIPWFIQTLRRPQVQTVYVDEFGNQVWGNVEISRAQRVQSVVVGLLVLYWLYLFGTVLHACQTVNQPGHQHKHFSAPAAVMFVDSPPRPTIDIRSDG